MQQIFLFIFQILLNLFFCSQYFEEYNKYDYLDNGDNWQWDDIQNCKKSLIQSPIDLTIENSQISENQYMFPHYNPGKMNVTKLNTTVYLNSVDDTGLGRYFQNGLYKIQNSV
ncbi:hypothetical protein IMG5_127340 [Ichthyophthirius multifiliis]|uniref:Uncharacterized protein n=1 Tax=Ichthyophthirius multifiliis TaxID=5932 RepID=G0QVW5_ICHMU|nr:hypothetical protein IMG5_127340 [Ichthyophthirius multifiliis]EGR30630.1 hypothetical protein IMG5_127340 [Ichthyophthirius multifiliis]|eukprot:XP_004032217.1 hypothetical protein IMG5_127340 [Ichthyophthirius multifiliis]